MNSLHHDLNAIFRRSRRPGSRRTRRGNINTRPRHGCDMGGCGAPLDRASCQSACAPVTNRMGEQRNCQHVVAVSRSTHRAASYSNAPQLLLRAYLRPCRRETSSHHRHTSASPASTEPPVRPSRQAAAPRRTGSGRDSLKSPLRTDVHRQSVRARLSTRFLLPRRLLLLPLAPDLRPLLCVMRYRLGAVLAHHRRHRRRRRGRTLRAW